MHFGRVANDKGMDLRLPAAGARTERYLALGHRGRGLFYPGAPIWAEREWVGTLYEEGTRPGRFLREYAQHFASVEYNGSFYALPQASQVRSWASQVGPEFRFCPKLPKSVSHALGGSWDRAQLAAFLHLLPHFGERHGMSFMQLPDAFGPREAPALRSFLQAWSREWPLAIEFRHPAWFHDHRLIDPLVDELYRHGVSAVITDSPGRRDALHQSLMHPQLIIRFLGCFPSMQDEQRLTAWVDRVKSWTDAGLDSVYFFVHQERHGAIPANINYVQRCALEKGLAGLMRPAASCDAAREKDLDLWLSEHGELS